MTAHSTQNPRYRIHGVLPYDRGAKARWLLTELGLDFESRWLDREKNELESADFLKLNPMGRIPVLEMGEGQSMIESGAICAYLGDLHAERGIAPAVQSPERAIYQQWMYFAAATLDVFQTRIMIIEDIPTGEVQATKMAALEEEFRAAMMTLDRTLSQHAFLVGDRLTVADLCVSYHLYWCKLWPELDVHLQAFPKVVAYLERMVAMPSAKEARVFSYEA